MKIKEEDYVSSKVVYLQKLGSKEWLTKNCLAFPFFTVFVMRLKHFAIYLCVKK